MTTRTPIQKNHSVKKPKSSFPSAKNEGVKALAGKFLEHGVSKVGPVKKFLEEVSSGKDVSPLLMDSTMRELDDQAKRAGERRDHIKRDSLQKLKTELKGLIKDHSDQ